VLIARQREGLNMESNKLLIGSLIVCAFWAIFSGNARCATQVIDISDFRKYEILQMQNWEDVRKAELTQVARDILKVQEYEPREVHDFLVTDLNNDGTKEIVATINAHCSGDSIGILVVYRRNDVKVMAQYFDTHWGHLKHDIKDIDGDGSFEIITKNVLAESTGHVTCVQWPRIYKWDGQGYTEASRDFPEYYRKIVRNLDTNLDQLSKVDLEELAKSDKMSKEELAKWQQFRIADVHVAQFKAKQLLGEEKAGFDHAVQWSSSTERELRRNAVTVFAGIMDRKSRQYLQKLAKDSDSTVALSAGVALKLGTAQVPSAGQLEKLTGLWFLLIPLAIGLIVIGGIFLLIKKKSSSRGKSRAT